MKKNYSITEELRVSPCKHTEDGYCLRNENDYCLDGECQCPHWISEIKVIASTLSCETTAEICAACKAQIDEPKTDCR